jgi:cytochrome P450
VEIAMSQAQAITVESKCPYHAGLAANAGLVANDGEIDERKSAAMANADGARTKKLANGGVKVESFALTRKILRGGGTRQAGFMAELVTRASGKGSTPVLFQEGEVHQKQRTATARFFAPRIVTTRYRELMDRLSEGLMERLRAKGHADLSEMSLEMAVAVAAEIIGLTDSSLIGMSGRLNSFFTRGDSHMSGRLRRAFNQVLNNFALLGFFWMDVKPAIRARRKKRKEDVISYLIDQGYSDAEILTECMTYGAAGMVTTREFIVMASWHLMERDALRRQFLDTDEAGRIAILEEILRLEPVVGALYRRAAQDLEIDHDGGTIRIPAGTLIEMDIRAANADPAVAGACPYKLNPERNDKKALQGQMSFGDGNHRCPGATVALQETAIFLDRLFRIPGLRLEAGPVLAWNTLTVGYELRDAILTVG